MDTNLTRQQAYDLVATYNQEPFHLQHATTVGGVMRYYAAEYDPENIEFWGQVGLMHDIDYEKWPNEHCVKCRELLGEAGVSQEAIDSVVSHGWGMTGGNVEPTLFMQKVLFATDELTGLIGAAILVRPSKSAKDLEVKSLKKKFKDKAFASGCSRDVIRQGAEMLGWPLDELFDKTILAMRTLEK